MMSAAPRRMMLFLFVAVFCVGLHHRNVVKAQEEGLALGVSCDSRNPYCAKLFANVPEDMATEYHDAMRDRSYQANPNVGADTFQGTGPNRSSRNRDRKNRKLRMTDRALFRAEEQDQRELSCSCGGGCSWCCNKPLHWWCQYWCSWCTRRELRELMNPVDDRRAARESTSALSPVDKADACQKILQETRKTLASTECGGDVRCMQFVADENQLLLHCVMS